MLQISTANKGKQHVIKSQQGNDRDDDFGVFSKYLIGKIEFTNSSQHSHAIIPQLVLNYAAL